MKHGMDPNRRSAPSQTASENHFWFHTTPSVCTHTRVSQTLIAIIDVLRHKTGIYVRLIWRPTVRVCVLVCVHKAYMLAGKQTPTQRNRQRFAPVNKQTKQKNTVCAGVRVFCVS